jgi:aminoglycoside 6'-N-acetyltransferase I
MKIRPIQGTDRAEWLRLLLGLHPELVEADHVPSIDAYLSNGSIGELIPSAVFVAERQDRRLGGFLELSVRNYAEGCIGDTPYVESWYVDADLRGTGIGRALMEAAERWARDHGFTEPASDALLDNSLSHAAHRALGFEVIERIVVFRKSLLP